MLRAVHGPRGPVGGSNDFGFAPTSPLVSSTLDEDDTLLRSVPGRPEAGILAMAVMRDSAEAFDALERRILTRTGGTSAYPAPPVREDR